MEQADHRFPSLDGLRGISILWVILHNTDFFPSTNGWLWPAAIVASTGWMAVQLFFVLSGFLITWNLINSRGAGNYYRAFFGRRVLRIFPLYYLTLGFFLFLLPKITVLPPEILESYVHQWPLWVFLNNWSHPAASIAWFSHFWSLAIEEQFYLVWPLVIAFVSPRLRVPVFAAFILTAWLTRIVLFGMGTSAEIIYRLTPCRMDALAFGALGAVAIQHAGARAFISRHGTALVSGVFAAMALGALETHAYNTGDAATLAVGYTLIAASMTILLLVAIVDSNARVAALMRSFLTTPVLRSAGKYSYAMYILHLPISLVLFPLLLNPMRQAGSTYPLLYSLTIMLLSYAAAWLSWHLLEKHFLSLKRYFATGQSTALGATANSGG